MDFTKAFDSVVWDALNVVLQHFGFGQNLRRWIKVLFPGTLISIMFNGRPLAPFELGAGARQGYPLSLALFVLFIESFLNFLRAKMQGLGLQCESLSYSVGTPNIFSDMSTNIVWLHGAAISALVNVFQVSTTGTGPIGCRGIGQFWTYQTAWNLLCPQFSNTDRLQRYADSMFTMGSSARTLRDQVLI